MLRRIFPACTITPFGSTINGLGRSDGDLDMIMELEPQDALMNQVQFIASLTVINTMLSIVYYLIEVFILIL